MRQRAQIELASSFSNSGSVGRARAQPATGSASLPSANEKPSDHAHVAILLAVKNGARFLPEQLESFAQQTHGDWALHVSDDGSDDKSVEIVQEFAKRQSNLVTLREGPRAGSHRNFLSLLRDDQIDADFFAFSDQDDVWHSDKLERAINVIRRANDRKPALYCSRTELIDHRGRCIGFSKNFRKPPSFRNALVQSLAGGNTMVFNRPARELLRKVADGDVVVHDWMTYIAISAVGGTIFYDSEPSVGYRQHEENLVGSNKGLEASFRRLRMVFRGQWHEWNSLHLTALERLFSEITSDNRQVFDNFSKMRRAEWLPRRLWYLWKSGVYRQTVIGQLGLVVAALFRKL